VNGSFADVLWFNLWGEAMPTTIDDAFAILVSRVELNPSRVALASQRYNAIKAVVEARISGSTVRQIGSFQRKTKIRPQDLSDALDVDALAVLGEVRQYSAPGEGFSPAQALEHVRRALRADQTYMVMAPKADAPVVSLDYSDGFRMEIAVGYRELTGQYPRQGDPACYVVADKDQWRPADYDFDAQLISRLNQQSGGGLVPMIKLLKRWTRNQNVPLKSFHLEILAASILPGTWAEWKQNNRWWNHSHSLAAFLQKAGGMLVGPVRLDGSFSPAIDSGLSVESLREIAAYFADRAQRAWKLCGEDNVEHAIVEWQKFFGLPFPAMSGVG
jgi:Second Messenger Oligonucleotide or Dinucleotide Synthetase domain